MVPLTVVLGVDAKTLPQLKVSFPTWKKNRPQLRKVPLVAFCDDKQIDPFEVVKLCSMLFDPIVVVEWGTITEGIEYASQREKMLSGFVHVPGEHVETEWWLKIDTDSLALDAREDWIKDEWFEPLRCDSCGSHVPGGRQDLIALAGVCEVCDGDPRIGKKPVYVASPWSYTKPANQMHALDEWGDMVPGLGDFSRLNLAFDPEAKSCRHPRMASWLSYYSTDWTREAAAFAVDGAGEFRIPVPSQDGYHYYVAARTCQPVRRVKMKRHGWNNFPRFHKLQEEAARILGENDGVISI